MRDELYEPLGCGPAPAAQPPGRPARLTLIAAAALAAVAAPTVLRETPQGGAGFSSSSPALAAVSAEPPPLRPALDFATPPRPAAAATPSEDPPRPKTPRPRAAAPAPLIIDVRQALAAMRAKEAEGGDEGSRELLDPR